MSAIEGIRAFVEQYAQFRPDDVLTLTVEDAQELLREITALESRKPPEIDREVMAKEIHGYVAGIDVPGKWENCRDMVKDSCRFAAEAVIKAWEESKNVAQ